MAAGARVWILDPIKSDRWGLTSTADGKGAGLPFHILGGHAVMFRLPLSILDMADFNPGGQASFFA